MPQAITDGDGPFTYNYVVVMGVPGIKLADEDTDLDLFNLLELNAKVILTRKWDMYCQHVDRSSAIALLLLTAYRGNSRFPKFHSRLMKLCRKLFGVQWVFELSLIHI